MSEWVRTSERLPTEDPKGVPANSILAYGVDPESYHRWKEKFGEGLETPERFIACYVPQYGFLKNGFYFQEKRQRGLVTHWMPLPQPPTEEATNDQAKE